MKRIKEKEKKEPPTEGKKNEKASKESYKELFFFIESMEWGYPVFFFQVWLTNKNKFKEQNFHPILFGLCKIPWTRGFHANKQTLITYIEVCQLGQWQQSLDARLLLWRKLRGELNVEFDSQISFLGWVLRDWHPFASNHFLMAGTDDCIDWDA